MRIVAFVLALLMAVLFAVSVCAETIVITGEPPADPTLPFGMSLDTLVFFVSMICTAVVYLVAMLIITSRIKKNRR